MALTLRHQTPAQFMQRLRAAYRRSERDDAVRLGEFILSRIEAGDLSDDNVAAAFGKSNAEWNVFKARLRSQVSARNIVRGAVGD